MTRYWRLRLRNGSTRGPWLGSKTNARAAALRAGGWRRLPPGAVIEEVPRLDLIRAVCRGELDRRRA